MRKAIVYLSIMLILVLSIVFRSDYMAVELEEAKLQNDLNALAKSCSMMIDEKAYGEGYIQFRYLDIYNFLSSELDYVDEFVVEMFSESENYYREVRYAKSTNGYVLGRTHHKSYIPNFSDIEITDYYENEIVINSPTVIITVINEKEYYRIAGLKGIKTEIVKNAIYSLDDR